MTEQRHEIDIAVIPADQRFDQLHIHHRVVATHRAAYILDLVKIGSFPHDDGPLMPSQLVIDRAFELGNLAFDKLLASGDLVGAPSIESMKAGEPNKTGFTP